MSENLQIRLTRKEYDEATVSYPSNYVHLLMPKKEELKTKAGIIIGFNEDVTYGESDTSHIADVTIVRGEIVKQVDRLYFNRKDIDNTMSWSCDVDTQMGDIAYSHPLALKNCPQILVEDDVYSVIKYEDILVAKRHRWISKFDGKETWDVICTNGYAILELVQKEAISELDLLDKDIDKKRGIVKYVGKPNKLYQNPKRSDIPNLEVGDLVTIDPNVNVFFLERSIWNLSFDGDKQYLTVQMCDIEFVL